MVCGGKDKVCRKQGGVRNLMDEEMETLYGALAHPENDFSGLRFFVPRMRNQQIFEANSGFKICLLRHFSMFEAKTGLKVEAVFGLKNPVGLYGFQACSGTFFVSVPMEPTGN